MRYTLTPAYGRDYKGKKALLADLNADKDFMANSPMGSAMCNSADLKSEGVTTVNVRYKKQTMVAVVALKNGVWK
jgi:hypothetical protein